METLEQIEENPLAAAAGAVTGKVIDSVMDEDTGPIATTTFDHIKELVDENDQCEAYRIAALYLKMSNLAKIFGHISEIHHLEGHLPGELNEYRHEKYQQMIEHARSTLTADVYKEFHQLF